LSAKETALERLQLHAREWPKYTLASAIVQRTRDKHKQKRQPSVISQAQEFFTTITGADTDVCSSRWTPFLK